MKCPECNDAKWEDRREELQELLEKVYNNNFSTCEDTADYVAGKLWGIRQLALAVQEHLNGNIVRLEMLAGGTR